MNAPAMVADIVPEMADDVIRQMVDGTAPHRTYNAQAADGSHRPQVRIFFADLPRLYRTSIPEGVARVALDLDPVRARRPAHEVQVYFERPAADGVAAAIAAAVLDQIDNTADYAR